MLFSLNISDRLICKGSNTAAIAEENIVANTNPS
jgi:hypothetical protein